MGAGYFKALNDSDFSDPDEILVVKGNRRIDDASTDEFLTGDDRAESRSPTLYDAGFQVRFECLAPLAPGHRCPPPQKKIKFKVNS